MKLTLTEDILPDRFAVSLEPTHEVEINVQPPPSISPMVEEYSTVKLNKITHCNYFIV